MKPILVMIFLFLTFHLHADGAEKLKKIETKDLVGYCGDGIINGNEQCDGTAVSVSSCRALGGGEGNVRCQNNCVFDISDCSPPSHDPLVPLPIRGGIPREIKDGFCGDGIINGANEDC